MCCFFKMIKQDLESKLNDSETSSNKLREQIDRMNTKFEEWRVNYNDMSTRLSEMDKIESKIKANSKLSFHITSF